MGNSGGPLVNVDGQVIGMNTAIFSPTGGSNGIGFAIPSNQVRLIENLLVSKGKVVRSMIGVRPQDVKEFERTGLLSNGGARVEGVVGEPAKSAGLQKDDVIVRVGTTDIHDEEDLRNAMLAYAPGTSVPVEVVRSGQHKTINVKLMAYALPKEATSETQQLPHGRMRGMPFPFGQFNDPFGNMPGFQNPFGDDQGNGNPQQDVPSPRSGHPQLGVQVENLSDQARADYNIPTGISGAVVVGVVPDTLASGIGMQQGDVVESLNGRTITNAQDLKDAMSHVQPGSTGHIKFMRFDSNNSRMVTERDLKF
jgi:serine protease Do